MANGTSTEPWINESARVNMNLEGWAGRRALYLEYKNYALDVEIKPLGSREFYNRIEQINGITKCKRVVDGFKGIELLPQPPSGGRP